ncbi:MAG: prepilin-type N-terminal cleavage/methylation domain-containing protein [Fibrobacteria bacterium]
MSLANKQKRQQGFTLVEVIVVAIIVAALAAVAIPLYNGYVTTSRNNAAANAAGSVASFMGACVNSSPPGVMVTGATTTATAGPFIITCTANGATIAVPAGISLLVTNLSGTGQVTATSGGGAAQTYSY